MVSAALSRWGRVPARRNMEVVGDGARVVCHLRPLVARTWKRNVGTMGGHSGEERFCLRKRENLV